MASGPDARPGPLERAARAADAVAAEWRDAAAAYARQHNPAMVQASKHAMFAAQDVARRIRALGATDTPAGAARADRA